MNITTFTVEGPVLDARLPLPCPVEATISPYPWNDFLADMTAILDEFVLSSDFVTMEAALSGNLAQDGTCYWIRADLDTGSRYLRVYAERDEDDGMTLAIAPCDAYVVPGRLRLN